MSIAVNIWCFERITLYGECTEGGWRKGDMGRCRVIAIQSN